MFSKLFRKFSQHVNVKEKCESILRDAGNDTKWMKTNEFIETTENFCKNPPTHFEFKSIFLTTSIDFIISKLIFVFLDMTEYINSWSAPTPNLHDSSKIRVFSSLLSYPLTFSHAVNTILPNFETQNSQINVSVIGARAEASLPLEWWKHALYSCKFKNQTLTMFGPGLQDIKKQEIWKQNVSTSTSWKDHSLQISTQTSDLNNLNNNVDDAANKQTKNLLFHNHPNVNQILLKSDLFILFNPGFGSKLLRSSWEETIRLLIQSRKPVFSTCHCEGDLRRDLKILDDIQLSEDFQELGDSIEFIIEPQKNPFRSFKSSVDETESEDCKIYNVNDFIYAFKGI
jgi:hypothetical protein